MGLLDRFKKSKKADTAKARDKKRQMEDLKKKQFQAVPGASGEKSVKREDGKEKASLAGKPEKKKGVQKLDTKNAPKVLIRPIISEKATALGINNQYIFEVSRRANKIEVKKAIHHLYGVRPFKVNITNLKGRQVRYGKNEGRTKNWKKAIITLRHGDKIDIYNI